MPRPLSSGVVVQDDKGVVAGMVTRSRTSVSNCERVP